MAPRPVSARFRIGLLLAAVALGAFLTATPRAGQELPGKQGVKVVQAPKTPAVPTIRVPNVSVPLVPVTGAGDQPPSPPAFEQTGFRQLTAERAEAFVEADRLGVNYLPGEVLVKFKPGMNPADQNRALQALDAKPTVDGLEWRGEVAVVRDATQPNAHILAGQLSGQPEVEYAEPNFIRKIGPNVKDVADRPVYSTSFGKPAVVPRPARRLSGIDLVPTDPFYLGYQWNFNLINMPLAWDLEPGGQSAIIVAVIDTGITGAATNMTFPLWTGSSFQTVSLPYGVNPDLLGSRHVAPRDYAFLNPSGPVVDMDGHATHVSSTIGEAANNGLLGTGMAYNVRIMPVKVCAQYWELMIARAQSGIPGFLSSSAGGCDDLDIADGVRYAADNGARVMNISLGGEGSSSTIRSALAYAVSKGAFVAIAMGNDFLDGNPTNYPAAYAPEFDGVMSVAAIGLNQQRAFYSSTGAHCEIAAPGGDSHSGVGRTDSGVIWQSTLRSSDVAASTRIPRFDRYDLVGYQGTSMATPHVAGLAALLMSHWPSLTPAQVEGMIRASAKDLGERGWDSSFGYGLIQPRTALFGQGIGR